MDRPDYFQTALSNFATDVACGGAIRHLTDIGYTLEQIVGRLDYPTPRSKAQRIMMEHLYERRVLLLREPSPDTPELTMLSQSEKEAQLQTFLWKESMYDRKRDGKLTELLHRKCELNGESGSYVACAFSFLNIDYNSQNIERAKETDNGKAISCLNSRQREYLLGIRWEQPVVYHRLDQRMREIVGKLYEAGSYSGACLFTKTREKLLLQSSRGVL